MDTSDSRYKKLVTEYADDPEFLALSEPDQDSVLETSFQKMYGEIPKTENFLQKAISSTQGKPLFSASDTIPIAHQFAEGIFDNAPQNIIQNPMTTALSGLPGVQAKAGAQTYNIASIIPGLKDKIKPLESENSIIDDNTNLTPQTLGGKILGMGANIAGGSVLPAIGAGMAGVKAVKGLRTSPLKKEIRGIEELIGQSKSLEDPINEELGQIKNVEGYLKERFSRTKKNVASESSKLSEEESLFNKSASQKAEETAYEGSKSVKSKVDQDFKNARDNYRNILDTDVSKVTIEDLTNVLDKTIEAKGIRGKQFVRPSETRLMNLREEIGSRIKDAIPDQVSTSIDPLTNQEISSVVSQGSDKVNPKLSDIKEIKNFKNKILDSFGGNIDLEAEFIKHLNVMLKEKGINGYDKANNLYTNAYNTAKGAKRINAPALKRVATGKTYELGDLSSAEKSVGTNSVGSARKLAQDNDLQRMMYQQKRTGLNDRLMEGENKLASQQSRLQKRASGAEKRLSAKGQEQEALKSRIPELNRQIDDRKFKQHLALTASSVVGGTGIGWLLSKILGIDNKRP